MSVLFGYIFRQVALPFVFFASVLTMMIWLTQSLRMLDFIINGGQSFATFFYLIILVLPSMLTVILPIALFCGVLYGLHRLSSESETTVMWAGGMGRWRMLAPIVLVSLLVAIANLLISVWLMPLGYRNMKDRLYEIRSDLAASFIREGQFTSKVKGLTVYIASAPSRGDLKGILVHDSRRPDRPRTYLAERGVFLKTPEGPRLMMQRGEVQEMADRDGQLQVLKFDSTILDLGQFEPPGAGRIQRDLSERYLHELFNPPEGDALRLQQRKRFIAEAHSRIATPLYSLSFGPIAFIAIMTGMFSRRGNSSRIIGAMVAVIIIRVLGFTAQSLASTTPALNPLQYAIPLVAIVVCAMIVMQVPPFRRGVDAGLGRLLARLWPSRAEVATGAAASGG